MYWTDQFGSAGVDVASAVAVAPNGDVAVFGYAEQSVKLDYTTQGDNDLYLALYSRAGDRRWIVQFGSPGVELPSSSIAVAPNGDIIVAGTVIGSFPGYTETGSGGDVFVARFNRRGQRLWLRQFGSDAQDYLGSLALAPSGDIYLAATSAGAFPSGGTAVTTPSGSRDAILTRLSSRGRIVWSRSLSSALSDYATGVAVNRFGEIFVAGSTGGLLDGAVNSGGDLDAFVAAFDRRGNRKWLRQSGVVGDEAFFALAVTPGGSPVAAGYTEASWHGTIPGYNEALGGRDGLVVRYTRSGTLLWSNRHGTSALDMNTSIVVARNGQIYAAGFTSGNWPGFTNQGLFDLHLLRISPDGTTLRTRAFGTSEMEGDVQYGPSIAMIGNWRVAMALNTAGSTWGHQAAGRADAAVSVLPVPTS